MIRRSSGSPIGIGRLLLLFTLPLLLYLAFSSAQKALEIYQLNREAERLQGEIAGLKAENAELMGQTRYYESDTYVEKAAREDLGLVKEGERAVVVLTPQESRKQPRPEETPPSVDTRPNWLRWWDFFFGPEEKGRSS